GDASYTLNLNLGGKSYAVNAATFLSKAEVLSGGEASVDTIDGAEALKFSYESGEKLIAQMNVSSLGVDENVGNVTVNVYSYGDEPMTLRILSKCETSQQFIEAKSVTLQKGWNKIVIPVTAFNCTNYGKLKTLRFNFEPKDGENVVAATQIAVGNIEIGG
ncbi:MAG: hypothetical protein IJF64_01840, partial [Clostridia bacterium]|nr:hypothetical protein [Clostridia bacterium]